MSSPDSLVFNPDMLSLDDLNDWTALNVLNQAKTAGFCGDLFEPISVYRKALEEIMEQTQPKEGERFSNEWLKAEKAFNASMYEEKLIAFVLKEKFEQESATTSNLTVPPSPTNSEESSLKEITLNDVSPTDTSSVEPNNIEPNDTEPNYTKPKDMELKIRPNSTRMDNTNTKDTKMNSTNTKDTDTKDTKMNNTNTKDTNAKDTNIKNTNTNGTNIKNTNTNGTNPKITKANATKTNYTKPQEPKKKDNQPRVPDPKEPRPKNLAPTTAPAPLKATAPLRTTKPKETHRTLPAADQKQVGKAKYERSKSGRSSPAYRPAPYKPRAPGLKGFITKKKPAPVDTIVGGVKRKRGEATGSNAEHTSEASKKVKAL